MGIHRRQAFWRVPKFRLLLVSTSQWLNSLSWYPKPLLLWGSPSLYCSSRSSSIRILDPDICPPFLSLCQQHRSQKGHDTSIILQYLFSFSRTTISGLECSMVFNLFESSYPRGFSLSHFQTPFVGYVHTTGMFIPLFIPWS